MRNLVIVCLILLIAGCGNAIQPPTESRTADDTGRQLVKSYCGSCHLAVAPAELDKKTWLNNVLPAMAPRLGIKVWNNQYYPGGDKQSISYEGWLKLVDYYKRNAPDTLSMPPVDSSRKKDNWLFSEAQPAETFSVPATTLMIAYDSSANHIITSNEYGDLLTWSSKLRLLNTVRLPSPAVDFAAGKYFTLIGTMQAVDQAVGSLVTMDSVLATNLPRPVQSVSADFNKDGFMDWLICGFGHEAGALILLSQNPKGGYTKQYLRPVAGALQVELKDVNKDGWLDIICLFAHADEGIWLFTNDQHGAFETRNLMRFPPHYGSTSFQLVDFDGDGLEDILYTCGDNSDYSRILKPFHGVYIFKNTGTFSFRKQWFYPINGATRAVAADFDQDGKKDIAVIAFFADLVNHPSEKFLLFQGKEKLFQFNVFEPPTASKGRWIRMEVADIDRDGDQDILLANYSKSFLNFKNYRPDWNLKLPLIILKNERK